jgi:hypothetical protein
MALDIYVGPLTRFYAGTWKTAAHQGCEHEHEPDPTKNPNIIAGAVRDWQKELSQGLKATVNWPEDGDLPYWTDKPDWEGWGALLLLAAYQTCPDKKPAGAEIPLARFNDDPAVIAAREQRGGEYPSLLLGAEWWLPLEQAPKVFAADDVARNVRRMARVATLREELDRLNQATLKLNENDLREAREGNPPSPQSSLDDAAKFAFAVLLDLTEKAITHQQPLLLVY